MEYFITEIQNWSFSISMLGMTLKLWGGIVLIILIPYIQTLISFFNYFFKDWNLFSYFKPAPKTYWNYRIIVEDTPDGKLWGVFEVYYKDGIPTSSSEEGIKFTYFDSLDDIKSSVGMINKAFLNPPLIWDEMLNQYVEYKGQI